LNKKQEALRRGLRSFIEDTSRELADLEGREIPRRPPAPVEAEDVPAKARGGAHDVTIQPSTSAPPNAPVGRDGIVETAMASAGGLAPAAVPERPGPPPSSAPPTGHQGGTRPAPVRVEPAASSAAAAVSGPPIPTRIAPAQPFRPAPVEPPARPAPDSAPPAARLVPPPPPSVAGAALKRPRPERGRRRTRHRVTSSGLGVDGVRAEQATERKGVCFTYFTNRECWQVPEAYCNTALQVCITRECPVYHLHRESMERRFAKKFKHFW